jgi:hypothetical protein
MKDVLVEKIEGSGWVFLTRPEHYPKLTKVVFLDFLHLMLKSPAFGFLFQIMVWKE